MEGCGQGTLSTMKSSCVREIVLLRETLVVMCSTDYKKSQLAKKKAQATKKKHKVQKKSKYSNYIHLDVLPPAWSTLLYHIGGYPPSLH